MPMCDLRVQHRLFCPSTCFFAPVSLVHSLAVWVTLALQNMPPKARAPEARMVFGWDQVSGVEFCTCSGPSRCLPTVCLIGLRHVISGILAGGIPGFRMVPLLLHSPSGMAWFFFDVLRSVSAAIPYRDDTMLSSLA